MAGFSGVASKLGGGVMAGKGSFSKYTPKPPKTSKRGEVTRGTSSFKGR